MFHFMTEKALGGTLEHGIVYSLHLDPKPKSKTKSSGNMWSNLLMRQVGRMDSGSAALQWPSDLTATASRSHGSLLTVTLICPPTEKRRGRGRGREKVRVASRRVTVMEAEKKRKGQKKQRKLLSYEELPDYMKENEYIRDHYRAEWPIRNALLSLFSWHNETLNIWTYGLTPLFIHQMPLAA